MKPFCLFTLFFCSLSLGAQTPIPKAIWVVIDGVRHLELEDQAKDDFGKPVSTSKLFPHLTEMRKKGVYLKNLRISNPAGISLPAYSDMFAGKRQSHVVDNHPKIENSQSPTIFEVLSQTLGPKSVAIFSSWGPLCPLSLSHPGTPQFIHSCGWKSAKYFKPEIFEGSRSDADTFVELTQGLTKQHPRFAFIHFGDADEEAHLHKTIADKTQGNYGIYHYHKALQESDYYVGRLWQQLQSDPFYRDQTYLLITTDHGRDNIPDKNQWWDHGSCKKHNHGKLCGACQQVFGLVMGPKLNPSVVTKTFDHRDLAPTVAKWLGTQMPSATGKPIEGLIPATPAE